MASHDKLDKMKELTDKLEQGIKDVYTSDKYINYLNVMSKFHSYSFRNSILLMMQKPDATHVAGFNAWKDKFKRSVNKGEKGIQILAPSPYRVKVEMERIDPNTQKPVLDAEGKKVTETVEVTKPAFRPVYVFDVSQTSGEPLPQLVTELTGNVERYNAFMESLKSVSPLPMEFEDIKSGAKGYCDPVNKRIAIKNGMSETQTIKTAIHEITHADLHTDNNYLTLDDKKDRRTKEVEAESVAFVVCSHYGIDTSEYSFAYVAAWSSDKELNELKSSLDTIQKQAAELIDRIDTRFQELLKEQPTQEQSNEPTKEQAKERSALVGVDFEKAPAAAHDRTFTIYQLKTGEENHFRRWESFENLQKYGDKPDLKNYDKVYTGKMEQSATLENIYQEFNVNRPADFHGHSLSMSDIIVVEANGICTAHYVDSFGFESCPDVAKQHEQQLINEHLDSVKFDNDIDLDKERSREQLGFNDKFPDDLNDFTYELMTAVVGEKNMTMERPAAKEKPLSMSERMKAAKETSKERAAAAQKQAPEKDKQQKKEREER